MAFLGLNRGEIILVLIVFGIVFGWSAVPKLGEIVGGLFEKKPPPSA
ncbi:MAG: hypothetical protein ACHREM_23275 [Polyangiales bacterium]